MFEFAHLLPYIAPIQWFAAIVFVPLVTWQFCSHKSVLCRWVALISAYAVQIGFFLILDDAGFQTSFLILISSIAAYFWITTTVALWPSEKTLRRLPVPASAEPIDPSEKASA
jgi:hypothetical protein